uniref:Uncharacterized protein n=1 Tax=Rhizophora mucronata TaxID=61149 RepID=A0A2P2R345_RHIMU
MPVFRERK